MASTTKKAVKKTAVKKAAKKSATKKTGTRKAAAKKPAAKKSTAAIAGRSFLRGEVTLGEIRALTRGFAEAGPLFADDMMDGSRHDVVVVDGDLHVPGDLRTFAHKLVGLVVCGSLTVDGLYADTDDPACGVFVLGDMRVGRAITTGSLGVRGSLTASEALVGDYNDYSAWIGGDVHTPLFVPENHYFNIGGRLEAGVVVGYGAAHRVPKALRGRVEALIPKRLRDVLVDAVLQDGEDELDAVGLRERVRENLPVLR